MTRLNASYQGQEAGCNQRYRDEQKRGSSEVGLIWALGASWEET